jgi:hypothetical protein
MRSRFVRTIVLWTLLMLALAFLLAVQATASLVVAGQDCFFNYPGVPCPGATDPAVVRLTVAFFGIPLIWLVGLGLALIVRALRRRRSAGRPV